MRYNRNLPYIRRFNKEDYAMNGDVLLNCKLSHAHMGTLRLYVLAIHGWGHAVITCSTQKVGIKQAIGEMNHHKVSFKQWCRDMRKKNHDTRI